MRRYWSDADTENFKLDYEARHMSLCAMAKKYNRTRAALKKKARELKIVKPHVCRAWTDDELEHAQKWRSEGHSLDTIAKRLNRSVYSLEFKLRDFGGVSSSYGKDHRSAFKRAAKAFSEAIGDRVFQDQNIRVGEMVHISTPVRTVRKRLEEMLW